MEPIFESDDVDLVISSGRWSDEERREVAEFFQQVDQEPPSSATREARSKIRNLPTEIIRPVVSGT